MDVLKDFAGLYWLLIERSVELQDLAADHLLE
jgi:hypothetical protein